MYKWDFPKFYRNLATPCSFQRRCMGRYVKGEPRGFLIFFVAFFAISFAILLENAWFYRW